MTLSMRIDPTQATAAATRVAQSLVGRRAMNPLTVANQPGIPTSSTATSGGSQGITSSDFLSLLVTEMKNQDPTQPTDPNAYVQQLVGVNSLQQLIGINQELGAALNGKTGSAAGGTPPVTPP
jgi:flagellar basal-body rod modification protein FlgD